MNLSVPIKYSEIYPGKMDSIVELKTLLPRKYMLLLGPSMISICDPNITFQDEKSLVTKYIKDVKLRKQLTYLLSNPNTPRSLFNAYSAYNLMELYYEVDYTVVEDIDDAEAEDVFWRVLLLLNEEFVKLSNASSYLLTAEKISTTKRLTLHLMTSISVHDVTNYDIKEVVVAQIIKSIQFFTFLESDGRFKVYLEEFYELSKVANWRDYLKAKFALILPHINNNDKTYNDVIISKEDPLYESSKNFLDGISLEQELDANGLPDFIGLRSRPVIEVDEDRFRIISLLFLIESAYKSTKFYFTRTIAERVGKAGSVKNLYSTLTDEFSEGVVLYHNLNSLISKKWIRVTGDEFKSNGYNKGEPDYYTRDNYRTAIVFESKDVVIKGEIKQSFDHKEISNALLEKFNKKKKNGGGVGIPQLVENCSRILTKYYSDLDSQYKQNKLVLYPVLLVHDRMFETPGVNEFLEEEFRTELKNHPGNFTKYNVKRLTVINIDTLIAYQEGIRKSGRNLAYFLDMHIKNGDENDRRNRKKNGRSMISDKYAPFSIFLKNRLAASGHLEFPQEVMEYARVLFN